MMHNRYPGIAGVRLDAKENFGSSGPAVDIYQRGPRRAARLFARDADNLFVNVDLEVSDLVAIRDGINVMLVDTFGIEQRVTINVPKTP